MSARHWPDHFDIGPIGHARGDVVLPGSKSITIRALLLAALAPGTTRLTGALASEDTDVMRRALETCGVPIAAPAPGVLEITGAARLPRREAEIELGNSGLSARTLLAVLAFMGGSYRLAGSARMHERPIADLVDALTELGARITYLGRSGHAPLQIEAASATGAREITVRGDASSQFLTGLLQAAPLLATNHEVTLCVAGELISRPYVSLTIDLMRQFGVTVAGDAAAARPAFVVSQGACYRSPGRFAIEGDASSASYFLALGALAGGPVRVHGIGRHSLQADAAFADVLDAMGASVGASGTWIEASSPGVAGGFRLRGLDADLNHMPDAAMTVALLALFADRTSILRNIGSWRVKETDRLSAMANELAKVGARITAGADSLEIEPPAQVRAATIATYDDHRMAMSFALAACGGAALRINEPRCVAKTYPAYFEELARLVGEGVVRP